MKTLSRIASILLFAILGLGIDGRVSGWVARADASGAQAIAVTDFRGKVVTLSAPAGRIVCLIESALSGIYMLGAEKNVIGVSTAVYKESGFPHYAAMDDRIRDHQLPTPGNWDFVNIEMVVSLRPDLVIIWSHQKESIASIEEKGIPVYGVYIESLDDIIKEINDLGKLTGTGIRADQLIALAGERVTAIRKRVAEVKPDQRPRVYFMWAQGELETSGGISTVQEIIDLAGGKNIVGHIQQEHLVVNMENILTWDPEVIAMWYNARKEPVDIMNQTMWRSVSAVKNRRVHEFPDAFSSDLWTLKYILAVELLARWCYPERFNDVTVSQQKRALLQQLYGDKFDPAAPVDPPSEK